MSSLAETTGRTNLAVCRTITSDFSGKRIRVDLSGEEFRCLGMTDSALYTATYGDVKGSVYGPNAEEVGGVWNMGSTSYHATGIFGGDGRPYELNGGQKETVLPPLP